jgi:glycosyltransferase involved in cell wall biosynthesis
VSVRIVQVQTQAEAAGAQRVSAMLGAGLRARGHDVRTVFMYRKTDAYDDDPYADFILPQRPRGLAGQMRAVMGLVAYLRRWRPDAVISFQHYGNIFGTLGGRLAGVPRLIANQSGAPHRHGFLGLTSVVDRQMGRLGAYHANVVNSGWTEAQFANYPPAYRARTHRINHGVAAPDELADRRARRVVYGLPQDAYVVVTSGRLSRQKNQRTLVEAVARLGDAHLAIAGNGPECGALVAAALKSGLGDRLHLVGEVAPERIYDFLVVGDCFAFASLTETFGLSVVEAALIGLPIVASDLDVLHEVLSAEGEPAALFVDPMDPDAIAGAIGRYRQEQGLASDMAGRGRRLASKYSVEAMCAAYERLLISP